MVNKETWSNNFKKLDAESQLEVAETISNELKINELLHLSDSYDEKKSETIKEFFNVLVESTNNRKELKDVKSIIKKYNNFSPDLKEYFISSLTDIMQECVAIQKEEQNKEICNEEGHIYGEWERRDNYLTRISETSPDDNKNIFHVCERCGIVETKEAYLAHLESCKKLFKADTRRS